MPRHGPRGVVPVGGSQAGPLHSCMKGGSREGARRVNSARPATCVRRRRHRNTTAHIPAAWQPAWQPAPAASCSAGLPCRAPATMLLALAGAAAGHGAGSSCPRRQPWMLRCRGGPCCPGTAAAGSKSPTGPSASSSDPPATPHRAPPAGRQQPGPPHQGSGHGQLRCGLPGVGGRLPPARREAAHRHARGVHRRGMLQGWCAPKCSLALGGGGRWCAFQS